MGGRGRPLRFLLVVLGGWTTMRVVLLWPAPPALPRLAPDRVTASAAGVRRPAGGPALPAPPPDRRHAAPPSSAPEPRVVAPDPGDVMAAILTGEQMVQFGRPADRPTADAAPQRGAAASGAGTAAAATPGSGTATRSPAAVASPARRSPARLHGDAYLVARGGRDGSLAFGELGASQAGARLTYALDPGRRLALSARVSAPLRGPGKEVAAGLDWRPTPAPVHLLVEDRYDLDAHRHQPAAELIAGVYRRLPFGLTLDGYAQGGAVARHGPFADGAARLFRSTPITSRLRLEVGAGSWGGAQRGAARLDLGPSASLALSRGSAGLRLGVDYRVRVAGQASPGSGPALTLGAGF